MNGTSCLFSVLIAATGKQYLHILGLYNSEGMVGIPRGSSGQDDPVVYEDRQL